jgi:hypothetical protein
MLRGREVGLVNQAPVKLVRMWFRDIDKMLRELGIGILRHLVRRRGCVFRGRETKMAVISSKHMYPFGLRRLRHACAGPRRGARRTGSGARTGRDRRNLCCAQSRGLGSSFPSQSGLR